MFTLCPIKNKDDYFLPRSKRANGCVFFCRVLGFDDEYLLFLRKFQVATQRTGVYLTQPLNNPDGNEVNLFYQAIDKMDFQLTSGYIATATQKWLPHLPNNIQTNLANAILTQLNEMQQDGLSNNILKNSFVKFMCWAKIPFERALRHSFDENVPKILYEGDISKYDLFMLRILSLSGCDVLYIHFSSESSYRAIDPASQYSQLLTAKRRGIPEKHFSAIDLAAMEQLQQIHTTAKQLDDSIIRNTWLKTSFMDSINEPNSKRGTEKNTIYTIFGCCLGYDTIDDYQARLYDWLESIKENQKPSIMIEDQIENPSPEEVKRCQRVDNSDEWMAQLALQICIPNQPLLETIVRAAFIQTLTTQQHDQAKRMNYGIKMLCWLQRYIQPLFSSFNAEHIPLFFYYGNASRTEADFLSMLAAMPIDVIFVSPNKETQSLFEGSATIALLENSQDSIPFPTSAPKQHIKTTAYQAEQQLDDILYSGTGLFRNRQFQRSSPATLKTTVDEFHLLWKEPAQFRPGFEEKNDCVVVPNLFAKFMGVPDRILPDYYQKIESMMVNPMIYSASLPLIHEPNQNPFLTTVRSFLQGETLLPDKIKKDKLYPFDHLSENTQDYMLEKMQQVIELHWIQGNESYTNERILATLLAIDTKTQQLIQNFDFTRQVPKVIIVHTDQTMATLEDCAYLLFLNLIGFDIAVFTPTGYRDIEKYIVEEAFQIHDIGEYLYDLHPPALHPRKENTGFFQRLFGKG